MGRAPGFAALSARKLRRLLERELGYEVVRTTGSHRRLRSPGRPDLTFSFHDGDTVGASLVRTILVRQVGLTLEEAQEVASRA
ncbi:type II toxin-antitoxin system HicA family toxin [Cryptosporangium phraense]|uniref:Type II toxin-antitoxin system HicA family toxin n=1 Tax=Cryptosporangium phraense TaxID=2593070 RepID=A0A545ASM2_9ACTN|nr:type II toxin-antitoxin system HicA family toxin [Cryptosporangium phraense]